MMHTYKPDLSIYTGIHLDKLPRVWFPFYVVYKYEWAKSTSIVGFDTDIEADRFQNEILGHKQIIRCEIFGHYPRELLEDKRGN